MLLIFIKTGNTKLPASVCVLSHPWRVLCDQAQIVSGHTKPRVPVSGTVCLRIALANIYSVPSAFCWLGTRFVVFLSNL